MSIEVSKIYDRIQSVLRYEFTTDKGKLIMPDFDEINLKYWEIQNSIKRDLRILKIEGQENIISNIETELLKIQISYSERIEHGFKIQSGEHEIVIEPKIHEQLIEPKINFVKSLLDYINTNCKNQEVEKTKKIEKLKFVGGPALFGYIFQQLGELGYIEIPKTRGEQSISKYAETLFEMFEIETTIGNLKNELNGGKNTLGDFNRKKFKLPNINDL